MASLEGQLCPRNDSLVQVPPFCPLPSSLPVLSKWLPVRGKQCPFKASEAEVGISPFTFPGGET